MGASEAYIQEKSPNCTLSFASRGPSRHRHADNTVDTAFVCIVTIPGIPAITALGVPGSSPPCSAGLMLFCATTTPGSS